MPNQRCAHCDCPIIDESTMVEQNGKTYCCRNCAAADQGD
jgi:hypothetical protein